MCRDRSETGMPAAIRIFSRLELGDQAAYLLLDRRPARSARRARPSGRRSRPRGSAARASSSPSARSASRSPGLLRRRGTPPQRRARSSSRRGQRVGDLGRRLEDALHVGEVADPVGAAWFAARSREGSTQSWDDLGGHRHPQPDGVDLAADHGPGQPAAVVAEPVGGVEARPQPRPASSLIRDEPLAARRPRRARPAARRPCRRAPSTRSPRRRSGPG